MAIATWLEPLPTTSSSQALSVQAGTEVYARLKAEINAAGILDRSPGFYLPLIVLDFLGYGLCAAGIIAFEALLPLTLACLGFTFFSVQLAGLMHDGGHRAAFASKTLNDVLGCAAGAAIGMVFPNWTGHHNLHHARPNQEGLDPDLEIPFIATSEELFAKKQGLQRLIGRWQAYYYYPMGILVGFSNRLGTSNYFFRRRSRANLWRIALYLPGIFALFVSPFLLFSLDKAIFVFLLVHFSSGIYLASCFAPNHKGMQLLPPDTRMSFIEQQVITARSVSGGFLTDLMLVGLNHQIEHHLFPNCPRNKLRRLKPYVRRACEANGITYFEQTFVAANLFLLRHLAAVARGASTIRNKKSPAEPATHGAEA